MFKLPTLSKLPSYKSFDYTPRYYDPVKEEFNEKLKKIRSQNSDSTEKAEIELRLKGSFKNYKKQKTNYYSGLTRGMIVVLFIVSLFAMLYIGYYALLILGFGMIGVYYLTKKTFLNSNKYE